MAVLAVPARAATARCLADRPTRSKPPPASRQQRCRARPYPFTLVSGDYHGKLIWWDGDADAPTPIRTVEAHDGWVPGRRRQPRRQDGRLVRQRPPRQALDAADGKPVRTLEGTTATSTTSRSTRPARGSSRGPKGVVKDWDLNTGKVHRATRRQGAAQVRHRLPGRHRRGPRHGVRRRRRDARRAPASRTCPTPSPASATRSSSSSTGRTASRSSSSRRRPSRARRGAWPFHPAGYVVAAGGAANGRIWFWKGDELASSHMVNLPANARQIAVHPSGKRLAVAGSNGSALVYSMK